MNEKNSIKKGFNAGYWIEKYDPELSKMIQQSFGDPDHPYAKGFVMGSREFIQETITVSMKNDDGNFDLERDDLDLTSNFEKGNRDQELEK